MKVAPKNFQVTAVAELREKFLLAQGLAASTPSAVLLNAPTGSGKTLMATALIDSLLAGSEEDGSEGDRDLVFLWLSDQPELNRQTYDKVVATSSVLTSSDDLIIIDAGFDAERFTTGRLYFLNTQKLGSATTFVKEGDGRTFTLWETLSNTVAWDPKRFVLIIDEAHRGATGKDTVEAETIMQKFVKGNAEIDAAPLVLGISATPDRFVKLCTDAGRPLLRMDVKAEDVRESGLLKEYVDLYHPDEKQPSHATMLQEAIAAWRSYQEQWRAYGNAEHEDVPSPVLVVQVEDAKSGSKDYSRTDLSMVVGTLSKSVPHDAEDARWIAHAFQDATALVVAGHTIRYLAPSAIDRDPHVKAVLFKTSLNTGWDCPRAETMVSFRPAKDETNIAQLVGRMVRAPLARRIDSNEHLNTVALYLPYFDRKTVEKVIARLSLDPANVPPTTVRDGKDAVLLKKAPGMKACFAVLSTLPTYTVPHVRPMKPVARLAKLAALLAELSLLPNPVKTYRATLVQVLLDERPRLEETAEFMRLVDGAAVLDIRRRRLSYAAVGEEDESDAATLAVRAAIADQNLEDLYADSGRFLGEGLHREYLRTRLKDESDSAKIKLELHALVATNGTVRKVSAAADALRTQWTDAYKAAIRDSDEKHRQALREIEGAGSEPEVTTIQPPAFIEGSRIGMRWAKHLYVDDDGGYSETFTSSWERKVVEAETGRDGIVGWLRNRPRKPWSLCIARQEGTKWAGIYPDFIFFRRTKGGLLADIVDPHLLDDQRAPARAAAIASYAQKHADRFGRIELVIYETTKDEVGKRLDLMKEPLRNKVAGVKHHEHLRQLFSG